MLQLLLIGGGSVVALQGCALGSKGIFPGLGDDYMAMLIIYRSDDLPFTYAQYKAVQTVAEQMNLILGWQLSSKWEAAASGGVAYRAAGAAGGATQGLFYTGALTGAAAGYTASVYGLGGVVNGLTTYSYGRVFDLAEMVERTIRDKEKYDRDARFARIHVVAAFVRSKNRVDVPAEELRKRMPDFTGDKVSHSRD